MSPSGSWLTMLKLQPLADTVISCGSRFLAAVCRCSRRGRILNQFPMASMAHARDHLRYDVLSICQSFSAGSPAIASSSHLLEHTPQRGANRRGAIALRKPSCQTVQGVSNCSTPDCMHALLHQGFVVTIRCNDCSIPATFAAEAAARR